MGQTMMGGAQHQGNIDLLRPEQSQFLGGALSGQGPAGQAYAQFLQPQSQEDLQGAFQKGVVDPMMQTYQQQTVPGLQQRFTDANASSSSALNQALGQSAQDLTTSLGAQYLPFMQGQQSNTLQALNQMGGLATQQTFQPMIHEQQGILGPLLGALGNLGGGSLASGGSMGLMGLLRMLGIGGGGQQ